MNLSRLSLFASLTAVGVSGVSGIGCAAGAGKPDVVVLDTHSFWRWRTVLETGEVVLPSGKVLHGSVRAKKQAYSWFGKHPTAGHLPESMYAVKPVGVVRLPAETSAGWAGAEFDDSSWVRLRGPMLRGTNSEKWKLILMRGRFKVDDPAKAGDLTLSLTFRGGAVVYVNGEEVARAFMPLGKLGLYSPAQPYPESVYYNAEGYAMFQRARTADGRRRVAGRIRRLTDCRIPAAKLRKGVNVLAVSVHRAPTLAKLYVSRNKGSNALHDDCHWGKMGLYDVRLAAPAGAAVVPNTGPAPGRGLLVWNHSIVRKVFLEDYPDPFAPLRAIRLTGVRNGTFAGQVVIGDGKPIKGLTVAASDLKGPGVIPAAAVRIRYAVRDGRPHPGSRKGKFVHPFDSLEESPPAVVPVYKEHGGSVQPVWVKVAVPPDAKPGDYAGTVTLAADGIKAIKIPINLRVADWTLPDPNRFTARMDIIESPASLAMAYGVEMWSDAHLKLLDKTFALLRPLANKTLYITAIRRTHFGNEHAMVRWYRDEKGELQPNFDRVETYLDVAVKHLGKVPGVILYCWEPISSMGHAGGAGGAGRTHDKPIQYTLWDRKRNRLKKRTGPAWGTPEAKVFWAKFNKGIAPVLKKRGLATSRLFGLIGDVRPTKQAMDDITSGVPGAKWAVHSHYYCVNWQGYPMGMAIALWGIGSCPVDPSQGYGYGWQNPFWLSYYPREMSMLTTLVEHRVKLEAWMGARSRSLSVYNKAKGTRGLGRLGADFWVVLKDHRGRVRSSLAGRYPESYWGQLNLNYGIPHLLGRGREGPIPTVRSEAFRENLQEVEARVFIERALADKVKRAALGAELAGRCRTALDKRIRMCLHAVGEGQSWFISSGWTRRTDELFGLAAEVAKALDK